MIRINLLPVRAAQKKEKLISQFVMLFLALGIAAVLCIGLQTMLGSKIDGYLTDIKDAETELSQLNKKIGEVNKVKRLTADLEKKRKVLVRLESERSGPIHLLDELSKAIPEKVWIESFQVSGNNVSLKGTGLTAEEVAKFMREIDNSPYYQNVRLGEIKESKAGNSFDLSIQREIPKSPQDTKAKKK